MNTTASRPSLITVMKGKVNKIHLTLLPSASALAVLRVNAASSLAFHFALEVSMRSMVNAIPKIRMALMDCVSEIYTDAFCDATHATKLKTPSHISSLAPKRSLTWVNHWGEGKRETSELIGAFGVNTWQRILGSKHLAGGKGHGTYNCDKGGTTAGKCGR